MKISFNQKELTTKGMGRREALKHLGVGSAVLLAGGSTSASAKTKLSTFASRKKATIVIVGGGTAGMTVAARLRRSAPNAKIILIAPNETHLYQSGQLYVATGLYNEFDNKRSTAQLLPEHVTWIEDKVTAFDPEKNLLYTAKHPALSYDYLVVATGCEYDYGRVEGLEVSDIGKYGIASVYLNDLEAGTSEGAIVSRMWLRSIQRNAEKSELTVLFADPDTPVKGEGTSLSMLLLAQDGFKGKEAHAQVNWKLTKADNRLFPSAKIDHALKKILKKSETLSVSYGYVLQRIEKEKKRAVYRTAEGKNVEISYDYLHITPSMQAPKIIRDSSLSVKEGQFKGWLEVEAHTLCHPKYRNIFGIGDVVGLPSGKSGGAVREQAIVLQDNIAAMMEGKEPPMTYEGYSASPIKTRYGRVMLAEYTPKGLAPTFPLNSVQPRWIWWEIDLHLMRSAYFGLMMRGML